MSNPLPKHQNPSAGRTASAPYNFVPLPDRVAQVASTDDMESLAVHDRYVTDGDEKRYTGHFDVDLTTKSPLFIRGMLTQQERQDAAAATNPNQRHDPNFLSLSDPNRPVIPGSSLRGMLRSLLEIVSFGKMQNVSKEPLFFRTFDGTSVSRLMLDLLGNSRNRQPGFMEAGFVRRGFAESSYQIYPCNYALIEKEKIGQFFAQDGTYTYPQWDDGAAQWYQWQKVWVTLFRDRPNEQRVLLVDSIEGTDPEQGGWFQGRLALTGDINGKNYHYVFFEPEPDAESLQLNEKKHVEPFHNVQLTKWQEAAFRADRPENGARQRDGWLREYPGNNEGDWGDPVFFTREDDNDERVEFFGRARFFRFPYLHTAHDYVPTSLKDGECIDYAEALFGYVRKVEDEIDDDNHQIAYAGRVQVTDGLLLNRADQSSSGQPYTDRIWIPRILSTPRPTAVQHYLVQQSDDSSELATYDAPLPREEGEGGVDERATTLRGFKRYWHHGGGRSERAWQTRVVDPEYDGQQVLNAGDTQRTRIKPVKPGITFQFMVYFENLSLSELGALAWVLQPAGCSGKTYAHHLGMGKPLGLGSVELAVKALTITERDVRYESLFRDAGWTTGETVESGLLQEAIESFEKDILSKSGLVGRTLSGGETIRSLRQSPRIAMLLRLMEWPGYPAIHGRGLMVSGRANTRYMTPAEYRHRPVLPGPDAFGDPIPKIVDDRG